MYQRLFTSALLVALITSASVSGATVGNFDGADTPVTFNQFGEAPGPAIVGPGVDGNFLLLTAASNGLNNFATFDVSDAGSYASSTFSFDFIIAPDATPSADGFSFSYLDTATHGSTGGLAAPPYTPEDPAAAGVLGFGFDTWSNQGAHDNPAVDTGSDYSEISVFFNGALVSRVDDTRLLTPPLTLDDGNLDTGEGIHTATGTVDFAGGKVSLQVDGNAIFTDLAVPGLAPFESRIAFAGRTGGENENVGLDNVNVNFVPEPATGVLALMGLSMLLVIRRKR
jgi:hypothetical protein